MLDIKSRAYYGESSGRYKGDWKYFVFDNVPEQFREFLAVHEFGEKEGGSHEQARKREYERVEEKGMLTEYLRWHLEIIPDGLIGDVVIRGCNEDIFPREALDAIQKIIPDDIDAWKTSHEKKKNGLHQDIWSLAWNGGGLTDKQIASELDERGYETTPRMVRYYRERMEIPNSAAIRKCTYIVPIR